jgi:UDP-GlcNAc3NAcA epimerase
LIEIVSALNEIHKTIPVVLTLHPRTKKFIQLYNLTIDFEILDPVGYLDMIALLKKCSVVITDSGGLQKESYFLKKPCVTVRDETEWTELVEIGANILAGANQKDILEKVELMLGKEINFQPNLYGDGNAGYKIASFLSEM